ncbi:DUF7002 family protein [Rhodoplanes sp. Z2-YC6860]|uniref:DUF7002 family protein n=1 Tax=Rhodoplanes sp. Z2-YC6860 TaxID=674703 RepID=UPI00078B296C|nr:hypothetical protein RHPLAN_66390 [Rhodoplanes sp. Z2-YC6860]
MALDVHAFAQLRPALFHYTARANLDCIRGERTLYSVRALKPNGSAVRRASTVTLSLNGRPVVVRDQRSLQRGHVELIGDWTWETLLSELDARVFFWPGTREAPIGYGQRLAGRYRADDQVLLRVVLLDLLKANGDRPPHFCRYNSGAPRTVAGRASPRGPDTFQRACRVTYPPGSVAEVSFLDRVILPANAECQDVAGLWTPLFS